MIRFLLILGVFLALAVPSVTGASQTTTKPKIIVGGDHDCPPYEFLENGTATGFDVELMRAVAEVMGFDVEFRLGPWNKVRQDLESGRIDALAGMYYSADRSSLIDFSVPHTMVTSGIFVRKDSPIRSYADIQGKEIIVQKGDIIHDSLRLNGLASRIVEVTDAPQALRLLASGKHDCAVMPSRLQGEHYVRTFGLTNIRFVNADLPQLRYCFAVRKGNQELLYKLDEGLKILKENGKYREIYERWFGVYEKKDLWDTVKYFVLAMAVVAALCVTFLTWSRMLKRRVDQRTAELRRSEDALRFTQYTIDNTVDQAFWMTEDGRLFYVNEAACRALGYTREELLKLSIPDIDPIYQPEKFAEHWRDLQQNGYATFETLHRAKDGRVCPVEIRASYVVFDGKEYNCAFATDISERKRAEEQLRNSEGRLRTLVQTLPDLVWLKDSNGVYLSCNSMFERFFGAAEAVIVGKTDYDFVDRELADFFTINDRKAVAAGKPTSNEEWITFADDGHRALLETIKTPVYDDTGGLIGVLGIGRDITQRKQAEEALRESEEKFRVLAETSPSGVCLYQGERQVYFNAAFTQLAGYTEQECLRMNFWDWIHPDYKEQVRERGLARQRGEPVPSRYEFKCVTKSGEEKWLFLSAGRIEYKGKPAGIVTLIDITDRKRMEEELRSAHDELEQRVKERTAELARVTEALIASEQEKSLILNITDAHVIYYDTDMNILWANKAAGDSVNMTPEELRERHCWEVWHRRKEPCAGCPVLSARDTGQPQEAEILTPDGRVWFIRTYPVRNETGRLIGMVQFTQDFTERKLMEEALREANLVVENSPAVLFRWKGDDEWPVELVSGNIIQFGYTPDEFLSGSITYSSIILPDDLERVTWEVHDFCNEGADQFRLEYRIMTKGGNIRWVNEHTNVERDAAGGVKNFEGIVIDITERKLAEQQLKLQKQQLEELNSNLGQRVREEVAKNREKDVILIQQNRQAALGEMLDHIAHQWKQPLNAISFVIQDLGETWSSGELTDEYVDQTVGKTMDLVEHMAQTIEVFRDFYRPEKEKNVFSIKESIDKALSFISPALRFHSIALELDVDPALSAIGYPKEYAQVLLNIMTNARDVFMERKTEKPRLEIKAFAEDVKAVVTITDNAGGIPDTIIAKIFDLYFTTRESSGGTGVGLYMSKNIIEKNMGGKLSVINIDNGASFRIELDIPGV